MDDDIEHTVDHYTEDEWVPPPGWTPCEDRDDPQDPLDEEEGD